LILNNTRIQQLVLFIEDFWQGTSIGRCVIYTLKKENDYRLLGNAKTEVVEAKTLMISQSVMLEITLTPKYFLGKLHCHDSDCFLMRRREPSSKKWRQTPFPSKCREIL